MVLALYIRNGTRGKFERVAGFDDTVAGRSALISHMVFATREDKVMQVKREKH